MKTFYRFIIVLYVGIIAVSCETPNGNNTPPQDMCGFVNTGDITFSEMKLKYATGMPTSLFMIDHDNLAMGFIEDFHNVLEDTYNFNSSLNDANILLTMSGIGCEGFEDVVYTKANTGLYGFNTLSNTPYNANAYKVKIELTIKSAVYMDQKCVWTKTFTNNVGSNTSNIQTGFIEGVWKDKDKAAANGKSVRVYVHDKFNNYIFTL